MATEQELKAALIKADMAGDTEAAQLFANKIKQIRQQPPQQQQGGMIDAIYEPAKAIGGGVIGSIAGGIEGLVRAPFQGVDKAVEEAKKTQQYFSSPPQTEQGRAGMNVINKAGEFVSDVGNFAAGGAAGLASLALNPRGGMDRAQQQVDAIRNKGLSEALGQDTLNRTGSPLAATVAQLLPDIALSLFGGGLTSKASKEVGATSAPSKFQLKVMEQIKNKTGDIDTAKYRLNDKASVAPQIVGSLERQKPDIFTRLADNITSQKPLLAKDPVAKESIKQGFDEGVVAAIKAASPEDRARMLKMVDVMEKSKANARFAMDNRPSDILGDSLARRVDHIMEVNSNAGQRLDRVAKSLKNEKVDFSQPVNNFIAKLDDMGIKLDSNFKPDFNGSDIEGLKGVEDFVSRVVGRMKNTDANTAYDVHRLKKYIDENVSYGKKVDGLSGKTESVMKSLRRELDQALDDNFPTYNEVNTVYADTRQTLDKLKDSIGKKINLDGARADKALGTELRKVMSNYQSRINIMDSIDSIQSTVDKYKKRNPFASDSMEIGQYTGGNKITDQVFNDDILVQALFVDELNNIFGTTARTSFAGETAKGVKQGMNAAQGGLYNASAELLSAAAEKARGINQDNAFKSIKQLLKEQDKK